MSDSLTRVSVALIRNSREELLWVWDEEWGCFALPMTRPKLGSSDIESPRMAAVRAAAKVLGVPARVLAHTQMEPEIFVSGRDLARRRYRYDVFRAEAHPHFADRLAISVPHLWLQPYRALSAEYDPLSYSCRWILATLVRDGWLPGRSQYTGALLIKRQHQGKWQFLMRLEPGWGYTLPAKRRGPDETYLAAAERAAREELGLTPGTDIELRPVREAVITSRDLSKSESTVTFYCHGVFEGELKGSPAFVSDRPLVWVGGKAVVAGKVIDQLDHDGKRAPDADVSPTARHILEELDLVPVLDPDLVRP